MKIVIAGAGEVGGHLAKLLSNENQDVIIIDNDESKLACLDSYNLLTHNGSPTSFEILNSAGVNSADLYIAVTPYETRNVTSCAMAKSLGAKKTVARVDNYEFFSPVNRAFFASIGVDELIYPEYLAAEEIVTALKRSWAKNWFELYNGELIVVGVKLTEDAELVGIKLKELSGIARYLHIAAIKHNDETIIPRGDDVIHANDTVYFATKKEYIDEILKVCNKEQIDINKIMIMGGSRIALRTSIMTGDKRKIKIIDNDMAKCNSLAEKLPYCSIVYGDGRDIEILKDDGIENCDAFIALTDSSETNILACIAAKQLGVNKTIAEVENLHFISGAEGLNIGTIVNKKLLASSHIFQIMLDTDSSSTKCLALADAEVAKLTAKEGSKITKAPVMELSLSRDMTIAGLIRDEKGMLVQGNTHIQAGDQVVVFCLHGSLYKTEKLFS
ncbi:MAG: Trk system potassium transporter TrkA [Bacteroidales bacterium]